MADTRALESIAELLPDDKRERFLANVVKFRNVPENDGQLQLLEAAGFIMLVMREIPRELDALLGRMRHGLSDEQRLAIRGDMEEILEGSIDAPSFEALRQLAADMRSSQSSFETAAATLTKKLRRTRHDYARHLAIGLAGGIVAPYQRWPRRGLSITSRRMLRSTAGGLELSYTAAGFTPPTRMPEWA